MMMIGTLALAATLAQADGGRDSTAMRQLMKRIPVTREAAAEELSAYERATTAAFARARAAARTDGCVDVSECQVLPMGERPSGGPDDFVVFCSKTTRREVLDRAVARAGRVQHELNVKYGMVAAPEGPVPPQVRLEGARCVAVPAAPRSIPSLVGHER